MGIFWFMVLLSACGGSDSSSDSPTAVATFTLLPPTATATPIPTNTPTPTPTSVSPLAVLSPQATLPLEDDLTANVTTIFENILDDAAQRYEMPRQALKVLGAKAVIWNKSTLECESTSVSEGDNNNYGYRIIVGDREFATVYHANAAGEFIPCEDDNLLDTAGDPLLFDPLLGESILQAREALAQRLGVPLASIHAVDALAITWQDTSLGCPVVDENYLAQVTAGFRIVLAQGDNVYAYHADFVGVQHCPLEREQLPAPFQPTATPTITPPFTATP